MLFSLRPTCAVIQIILNCILMRMQTDSGTTFNMLNPDAMFYIRVAKLLDSKVHFSKFEIFREPLLNMYNKRFAEKVSNITEIIFIENI